MRLLTKKKQNEALKRILANAIIAHDAVMKFDDQTRNWTLAIIYHIT